MINFTNEDILLIYGHFRKKLDEVEMSKDMEHPPIHRNNLNTDIKLYSSIIQKILDAHPEFQLLEDIRK